MNISQNEFSKPKIITIFQLFEKIHFCEIIKYLRRYIYVHIYVHIVNSYINIFSKLKHSENKMYTLNKVEQNLR